MKFGVHLPHNGPHATQDKARDSLLRFATVADELGYDSCWVSDHIAWPDPAELTSRYPYSADGSFAAPPDTPWIDPLSALTFVAAVTERIHLGTTVIVMGYRPPIQTAKLWASLDVLSNGRAILGVGVGWMLEEFEALGMPHDHRGARADEMLDIYQTLFTEAQPEHEGRFYRFPKLGFEPKPPRGRIPIWVGGNSAPAYRRTARYGDVFYPVFSPPAVVAAEWQATRDACEAAGRDPAEVSLALRLRLRMDRESGDEGALHGSVDEIVQQIGAYADVGVDHFTLDIARGVVDGQIEVLQKFASDVRRQV
jgi:probable F420-dependent oxidoreductase